MKAYIDSNVFVFYILKNPERAARCQQLLRKIVSGDIEAFSSVFTLSETHYAISPRLGRAAATQAVQALLSLPITFVPVDLSVLSEGLYQSEEHDISIYDAIHAATALIAGAECVFSYDKDFDKTEVERREP
ncbi:type II toxin-antitoxin system VapC family toxin [Candidatus Woesearchaeota archaeon]|nr:type II toxin-antitoxin system VapC family toxin [Candidatus Woesearchaeota archaeon]